MIDAEYAVRALERRGTGIANLAAGISLAVRIEPQLLRAMRLAVAPSADAGDEADLWFSDIVDTRAPTAITLHADAVRILRRRLAADQQMLHAAWRVVERVHGDISPVLLTEEEVTYRSLAGDTNRVSDLLRSAVATLVAPDRKGLAAWAHGAVARLPEETRNVEEAQMLAFGATLRLNGRATLDEGIPRTKIPEWAAWLSPSTISRVVVGVTVLDTSIEFGPPDSPKAQRLELPVTKPLIVDIAWDVDGERHEKRVHIKADVVQMVDLGAPITTVEIRTVLGDTATLSATTSRTPRVRITYDVETGGAIEEKELPFIVGVLADLSGHPVEPLPTIRYRRFVEIDRDNLDAVLESMRPHLALNVQGPETELESASYRVDLNFRRLADFEPEAIVNQLGPPSEIFQGIDPAVRTESQLGEQRSLLTKLTTAVLHQEDFQRLESTWRGLHYLVTHTESSQLLKIKVLNVRKQELADDIRGRSDDSEFGESPDSPPTLEQTALFKKVYEEEFGLFGGTPFGMLVGDYSFDKSEADVNLLKDIGFVAAAAHAPFVASASPRMFGMERFAELEEPRDLAKFFEDSASRAWNGFRETEVATYVGLCVPSMLMRTPYEHKMISAHGDTFDFTESTNPSDPSQYVWGGSAWALAARVTSAFARYGWCAMINGVEAGKVDDLPDRAKVDTDFTGLVGPVDARISDRREVELSNLGFIPLTEARSGRLVAFFSASTTAKPTAYDSSEATMAARLSARLPYVFATSRFAQYLKVIMRDKIGGFMSIEETERLLNEWIQRYLADGNELSADARARYPLAEARIDVQELPGTREHHAFAYLKPVFQLEPLPVSMRVVVRLPQPAM